MQVSSLNLEEGSDYSDEDASSESEDDEETALVKVKINAAFTCPFKRRTPFPGFIRPVMTAQLTVAPITLDDDDFMTEEEAPRESTEVEAFQASHSDTDSSFPTQQTDLLTPPLDPDEEPPNPFQQPEAQTTIPRVPSLDIGHYINLVAELHRLQQEDPTISMLRHALH